MRPSRATLVQGGAGKRRHDREPGQIDPGLDREASGLEEHLRRVLVHAEDEAAIHGDAMRVETRDDLRKVLRPVERLARVAQVLRVDRLEADQQARGIRCVPPVRAAWDRAR